MPASFAAALTTCQIALGDSIAPNLSKTTYSPEDHATVDASRSGPLIDSAFSPRWDWDGADVFSLAN